jgi:hypothetical protein
MRENCVSVSCAEGHSLGIEDLCIAMFIEGARVLGFTVDSPISLDAQRKILQAASSLSEKLAVLLEFHSDIKPVSEIGN